MPCLIYFCSKCGLFYYFSYSGKPQHNYDNLYEKIFNNKRRYKYICYSVEKKLMSFTHNYDEDSDLYFDDCVLLKKRKNIQPNFKYNNRW